MDDHNTNNGASRRAPISVRLPPDVTQRLDEEATRQGTDKSAVVNQILAWWVGNGCRLPDRGDSLAVVTTSVASGATSVVAEAIVDAVAARVEALLRRELAEALAVCLTSWSYREPLTHDEARLLVRMAYGGEKEVRT